MTAAREKMGTRRRSATQKLAILDDQGARHKIYITTSVYEDGRLGEIFVNMNRMGTMVNGVLDALAMTVSIALQHGVPCAEIAKGFCGTDYPPGGHVTVQGDEHDEPYEYPECKSVTDLLAHVISRYE